jgi:hypothetical protein
MTNEFINEQRTHTSIVRARSVTAQMDIGGMPHAEVLKSIELLGTGVAPQVRAELDDKV